MDGKSGYLCPPKDADALYDALRRFVELPESWRAEMGRRGREWMEKRFGKDAVIAETMKWLGINRGDNNMAAKEIKLNVVERFIRTNIQHYNADKYWNRRKKVVTAKTGGVEITW